MSNQQQLPLSFSPLNLQLIQWDCLPFRSHPEIIKIWGPRDAGALRALIEEDGGIRDALRCARIRGDSGKPILFDGYTRLLIHCARNANGNATTVPAFTVQDFDDFGQVLRKVLRVQSVRRNVTAPQIAHTALKIKEMQGFDITPKAKGRPKGDEKRNVSLKPLPSAKTLAKEFKVSDPIIRLVQQAMAHPDPSLLDGMIAKPEDPGYVSPTQAGRKLEAHRRLTAKAAREETMNKRRAKARTLIPATAPDMIAPNGLYTIDAIEGIKRIAPGTVDAVITSIPYPCDIRYDSSTPYDGDYAQYIDKYVRQVLAALKVALKYGGRAAINFDCTYRLLDKQKAGDARDQVPNLFNLWKDISVIAEDELGYLFMGYRIWYKQTCSRSFSSGSRNSRAPVGNPNTEFILIFGNGSVRLDGESDITQKEYDVFSLSHWYILPQRRAPLSSEDYHSVPFPEEIPYRLIRLLCPRYGLVLDPFNGSGTTTFVARALGRAYIGLDNSPLCTPSAARRLATLDGLSATERIKRIERFMLASEHGMQKHERVRGIVADDDGPRCE